ncbi:MAG: 3-dehydroquinate synthase family protein [Planctomycetota bacterium]
MIRLRCTPPGVPVTDVWLDVDLRQGWPTELAATVEPRARFALLDAAVAARHAARTAACQPRLLLAGGEEAKRFGHLEQVLRALAHADLGRAGVLLVVGGGSLGDLGGLAAALYCRGIDHVLVPTTLLAMVDSSVGGKTAIDLPEGKNLVGAFHPPRVVLVDFAFLATLPEREYSSGLGEVLKTAIGLSAELFAVLEEHAPAVLAREPSVLRQVVHLALTAKIRVVEGDFHERGPRRLLNLGHTLGHALEARSGFTLPHGLAVAQGLHFALDLAERRGTLAAAEATRARALLTRYGFVAETWPDDARMLEFVRRDKKAGPEGIDFVLPTGIGRAATQRLDLDEIRRALAIERRPGPVGPGADER